MSQNPRMLIIIADGGQARFVRPSGNGALHTVSAIESPTAHKRSAELGSDHPGATMHSRSSARHALAPRRDPHDMAEEAFARFIAEQVNAAFAAGTADQLLLVAPPRTLNTVRERLGKTAAAALAGTLGKDLVKTPDHELQPHLRQFLDVLR